MQAFALVLLAMIALLLAILVAIFLIEVIAAVALLQPRAERPNPEARRRIAVLVPAHNESKGLLPTLSDIRSQLLPGDRLLVVADNCSDDTAAVAQGAGAEVVERRDLAKRGKGYAMDFGVRHLALDPPEIVIFIDADCRLAETAIYRLASSCAKADRPVQALYLMRAPAKSMINHQVAEFAWRVRNWLRPLGLRALGLPCQLMGTGMAFPWHVIRAANLAHGWIVEDLKLGLDLALEGHAPLFCPTAIVTSQFAPSPKGAGVQRKRWEQGHIDTIVKFAPRLLCTGIASRRWDLVALTLDLMVPPLSLLGILVGGTFAVGASAALFGFSSAGLSMSISSASVLGYFVAASLAWMKCGRDVLPASSVILIAPYVLKKVDLYYQIASRRTDKQWNRTDRTKPK